MSELKHLLLQALPEPARADWAARPGLDAWLASLLEEAKSAFPHVALEPAVLAAFLAQRLASAPGLEGLRGKDLFLACAAHQRAPLALQALHTLCRQVVAREAARTRSMGLEEDALQAVEQLLLTKTAQREEALVQYSGKGELASFIRVIAVRELLRLKKGESGRARDEVEERALEELAAPIGSPELGMLRGRYREAFRDAFREAVGGLPARDRILLRQHFLDGLSLDALGKLNQVHRATVARWLAQARVALAELTREKLRGKIGPGSAELESVLDVVGSQLDISLGALLKTIHS